MSKKLIVLFSLSLMFMSTFGQKAVEMEENVYYNIVAVFPPDSVGPVVEEGKPGAGTMPAVGYFTYEDSIMYIRLAFFSEPDPILLDTRARVVEIEKIKDREGGEYMQYICLGYEYEKIEILSYRRSSGHLILMDKENTSSIFIITN